MALLVTLMVTSQLAITIFLPSMPSMAEDLGTSQALIQMTVSAYLGAFAIAQLVIGPLSDAIGRRRPLLAGILLFTLASIACSLAPDIETLIAARIVQAIGGCTCLALGRAIVRDTTDGPAATRAMAYLGMALALAPIVAPLIGGQLQVLFGWEANFLFIAGAGWLTLIATYLTLQETLPRVARRPAQASALARSYVRLLGMMRFMGYCLSSASMGGAFQAFIAGSPIALIVVMGLPPEEYGWFILEVPFGYVVGNFISSRLSQRIPRERMILTGGLVASTATCSAVVLSLMGMDTPVTLIVPMFFYAVGSGFLIPNALSGALTSVEPSSAGAAAAVSGFLQMGAGFLATVAIAALVQTSYLQVGGVMFCCTMLSWLIFLALGTTRA
jgi:DHA1 family bicyclomycin/chloramphenicol resistance-like MFS transporter